jgi:hypothetical protein
MLMCSIRANDHRRPVQIAPVRRGDVRVAEYRLGFEMKKNELAWQKLWHFDERCEGYPTRNFRVRKDRPPDDDLCALCNSFRPG